MLASFSTLSEEGEDFADMLKSKEKSAAEALHDSYLN